MLANSVPTTYPFELSYPEDLEELWHDELYELRQELETSPHRHWLLKPGMADKGQGIRLFRTKEELEAVVEEFAESDEDDDEDKDEESGTSTRVTLSKMRVWVIQVCLYTIYLWLQLIWLNLGMCRNISKLLC